MFVFSQLYLFTAKRQGPVVAVENRSPVFNQPALSRKIIRPPEQGLNLRRQHREIKGFCDKVIASHIHRHHDIQVIGGGRNKDHRHSGDCPDLTAPVVSVIKGQRYIQKYKLRLK